jgi:hypothetical protein
MPQGREAEAMWYRVSLLLRADVDDDGIHEIRVMANTYAILEVEEATRDARSGDCRFTARINAPSAEAALGSMLTVVAQVSGRVGLAAEASLRKAVIEREEPVLGQGASSETPQAEVL